MLEQKTLAIFKLYGKIIMPEIERLKDINPSI